MTIRINPITTPRNEFLLGKVLWDIRLYFRKFIEVADKAMISDTWRENLSPESQAWIREWYPIVKKWNRELRQIEKAMYNQTFDSCQLIDMLLERFSRADVNHFLISAALMLRLDQKDNDIGVNISRRLLKLSSLQRDLETKNFARLWMAEY